MGQTQIPDCLTPCVPLLVGPVLFCVCVNVNEFLLRAQVLKSVWLLKQFPAPTVVGSVFDAPLINVDEICTC